MPSRRESSARADYVPALCTHRPSLLPIEWSGELFGPRNVDSSFVFWKVLWTLSLKGRRSRNKVSVGEPAEGSFLSEFFVSHLGYAGPCAWSHLLPSRRVALDVAAATLLSRIPVWRKRVGRRVCLHGAFSLPRYFPWASVLDHSNGHWGIILFPLRSAPVAFLAAATWLLSPDKGPCERLS